MFNFLDADIDNYQKTQYWVWDLIFCCYYKSNFVIQKGNSENVCFSKLNILLKNNLFIFTFQMFEEVIRKNSESSTTGRKFSTYLDFKSKKLLIFSYSEDF